VSWYQKVLYAFFWIIWCKMKITQADTPTIRMDCHPIQTNWCPHLCHPHHFYARCPSWHNPPNLSWLGTGTKYAGLHTWWLGSDSYTKQLESVNNVTTNITSLLTVNDSVTFLQCFDAVGWAGCKKLSGWILAWLSVWAEV